MMGKLIKLMGPEMTKQTKELSRYTLRKNGEYLTNKSIKVYINATMVDELIKRGICKNASKAEEAILDKVFSPAFSSGMFGLGFDSRGDFGAGDDYYPMENTYQPIISY